MSIAIDASHEEFSAVLRRFLDDRGVRKEARGRLDADAEVIPDFWHEAAELGWLGLHLPERYGGSGFTLVEAGIVIEEIGHALAAGPFLPTIWASAVLDLAGTSAAGMDLLPKLINGSLIGAVCISNGGEFVALGAQCADIFLIPSGNDLLVVERAQLHVSVPKGIDPTRRVGRVRIADSLDYVNILPNALPLSLRVGRALAAAEASGIAHAATEMATEYAKQRIQFGRLIGTYQAVKHHAANMIVAAELATAVAWDSLGAQTSDDDQAGLSSDVAMAVALPAALRCTQLNIQLHGGIGFTWEHDAHMFFRRAAALLALFGPVRAAEESICEKGVLGITRHFGLELPAEAEEHRSAVRSFRSEIEGLSVDDQRRRLVESGYAAPHWPLPWGRKADAIEQIVIDEELAGIERPDYRMGGWIVPTILIHGTDDQIERFTLPTLQGDIVWCQLFSEPGAGSDAAGISTRASRVDGGWLVNGQKVWTTEGSIAHRGFATVRTDPAVAKHAGITIMAIDMHSAGVEVRPLREATGDAMFSEVFLDDVFVPDDDVIGPVNSGWKVARSALAGERVDIGRGSETPVDIVDVYGRYGNGDPALAQQVGAVLAQLQANHLLNLRAAERAVTGGEPGPEGNVAKLAAGETRQRVCELAFVIVGPAAALAEGNESEVARAVIWSRLLTIGGGTSEIVRNQIAERILGLPRDPLMS
jgi:3-oxochol-4-en-24-oyl-CoA dehydrogenase